MGSPKNRRLPHCQYQIFEWIVCYFLSPFGQSLESVQKYLVVSTSRSGLLKSCTSFPIKRSEIRKKLHDFKCVHFECRMVLFYMIWEKSRLQSTFFPQNVEKWIFKSLERQVLVFSLFHRSIAISFSTFYGKGTPISCKKEPFYTRSGLF